MFLYEKDRISTCVKYTPYVFVNTSYPYVLLKYVPMFAHKILLPTYAHKTAHITGKIIIYAKSCNTFCTPELGFPNNVQGVVTIGQHNGNKTPFHNSNNDTINK